MKIDLKDDLNEFATSLSTAFKNLENKIEEINPNFELLGGAPVDSTPFTCKYKTKDGEYIWALYLQINSDRNDTYLVPTIDSDVNFYKSIREVETERFIIVDPEEFEDAMLSLIKNYILTLTQYQEELMFSAERISDSKQNLDDVTAEYLRKAELKELD